MGARVRLQTAAAPGSWIKGNPGERRLGERRARPRERAAARRQPAGRPEHVRRALRAADGKQAALAARPRRRRGAGRGPRLHAPTSTRWPASSTTTTRAAAARPSPYSAWASAASEPDRRADQDGPLDARRPRRARAAAAARERDGSAPARAAARRRRARRRGRILSREGVMPMRKLIRLVVVSAACLLPAACATSSYTPQRRRGRCPRVSRARPGRTRRSRSRD